MDRWIECYNCHYCCVGGGVAKKDERYRGTGFIEKNPCEKYTPSAYSQSQYINICMYA